MKTIVLIFATIVVFTTEGQGDNITALIQKLEISMNRVNNYGNNFVGPLREKLNFEYLMTKDYLDTTIDRLYNRSLLSVKLAAEHDGVNASSCVKGLKEELQGIVNDKLPDFENCIKQTMDFAMEFAAFIQNQGNTGYVMIEGLTRVTKSYEELPVSQAEKCYQGLEWYASAVSYNYVGSSERYLDIGSRLEAYSTQKVLNCFQRPIGFIRVKLLAVEGRVNKCIADKINGKPSVFGVTL